MANIPAQESGTTFSWHRNLLVAGAVFTTLLIAMGGILCVTQSIRNCPDWPGCFGSLIPPAQTGPILEYTHRLLAGISSLLIVSSAIIGMVRVPQIRWVSIPPIIAIALLLEVSFFGAQVVLRGLSPGWATVDVGSALLVVALMVMAAVKATTPAQRIGSASRPAFKSSYSRLVAATTAVVYAVLVSGILVAGKGSLSGCLGWPLYNWQQFQLDGLAWGNILRLVASIAGLGLLVAMFVCTWRSRKSMPAIFRIACWLGFAFVIEMLTQALLQAFGLLVPILVIYTVTAAALWALLVAVLIRSGLETSTP